RQWGCEPVDIAPGHQADLIVLGGSPFQSMEHLRDVQFVVRNTERRHFRTDQEPVLPERAGHYA
ncbi:MAG: hypothetical protein WCS99_17640, partial [Limisphaerales bacterium]